MFTGMELTSKIYGLSPSEKRKLKKLLLSAPVKKAVGIESFLTERCFASGPVCLHCGSVHAVRNGRRADGTQRYICRDCGKSFVITTNSVVSGTQKDLSVWEKYIDCMMNGYSLRKTADICGVHRNTAFLWRHKILDALQNETL